MVSLISYRRVSGPRRSIRTTVNKSQDRWLIYVSGRGVLVLNQLDVSIKASSSSYHLVGSEERSSSASHALSIGTMILLNRRLRMFEVYYSH